MTADSGEFIRADDSFRDWVRADGSTDYLPEAGRYHLYVSLACPWAHRILIVRRLKRLEEAIGVTVVDPLRDDRGWAFRAEGGGSPDPVNGFAFLSEAYRATDPGYRGRITVPVLWDRKTGRIVSNDDDGLMRMLNREFDAIADASVDLVPEELRDEIDALNERIYPDINDGVYRCGFAGTQEAYDRRVGRLFGALAEMDDRLASRRYLTGPQITKADWRLFVTLVRFDAVYHGHFKCNIRRIVDFPQLSGYLRDLYQQPGIAETVNFAHIKRHYYMTHDGLNPTRIVPAGPQQDLTAPHGRDGVGR
jgi:putative glutathione S-transferase